MNDRFGLDFAIAPITAGPMMTVSFITRARSNIGRADHTGLRMDISSRIDPQAGHLGRQVIDEGLTVLRIVQQIHHRIEIPFLVSHGQDAAANWNRLHLQTGLGEARDELLFNVLITFGFDEGENVGLADVNARGLEGEHAIQIATGIIGGGGNGERGRVVFVCFDQMIEIETEQKAGALDDDEAGISEPVLAILDAAGGPRGMASSL